MQNVFEIVNRRQVMKKPNKKPNAKKEKLTNQLNGTVKERWRKAFEGRSLRQESLAAHFRKLVDLLLTSLDKFKGQSWKS